VIGLCQCGCGDPAPIAKFTKVSRGFRKGEPQRYIQGHQNHGKRGGRFIHGEANTPHTVEYAAWSGMLTRCSTPRIKSTPITAGAASQFARDGELIIAIFLRIWEESQVQNYGNYILNFIGVK